MALPTRDRRREDTLRLALPKGRMQEAVERLLADAGLIVRGAPRGYRPRLNVPGCRAKLLKPRNVVEMLHAGSRDLGFAGADWVAELHADLVELLDTGLDRVRVVAAAPAELLVEGSLPARPLVVASEYERLAQAWIARRRLEATVVRSCGATEVFPPEDADCIVDNTATGATLAAHRLEIVDEVMRSSTRLYANRAALDDPARREGIDSIVLLVGSVLEARRRAMLEVNVTADRLVPLVALLPAMRGPTIAPLHCGAGFAVKVAVERAAVPALIPQIKACGGTDIVLSSTEQIVP